MTPVEVLPDTQSRSEQEASLPVQMESLSLQYFVFGLFFVFGGITSLNDVLIPKLRELFTLSYAQAMLVQSAFFAAYLTMSIPAARALIRFGYMATAVIGLVTMVVGCLLFVPAASSGQFPTFLVALFVVAIGITTVQVVANPLISIIGSPRTAHSRLTFAQGFNSLGTTVFPFVGSLLILAPLQNGSGSAIDHAAEARIVGHTYLGIALALSILAGLVWFARRQFVEPRQADGTSLLKAFNLLRRHRFAFGVLGIFVYVGAEVTIGSLLVIYLMQPEVMGMSAEAAGKHVPLYWGGAMVGRFFGAWLLRKFAPSRVLTSAALGVIILLAVSGFSDGTVSGWALLAIGLFNSIMFPTIFSLASEGLGVRTPEGSGVICMAIVGGAVIPPLTGAVADFAGLSASFFVPAMCYAIIMAFGLYCAAHRAMSDSKSVPESPSLSD